MDTSQQQMINPQTLQIITIFISLSSLIVTGIFSALLWQLNKKNYLLAKQSKEQAAQEKIASENILKSQYIFQLRSKVWNFLVKITQLQVRFPISLSFLQEFQRYIEDFPVAHLSLEEKQTLEKLLDSLSIFLISNFKEENGEFRKKSYGKEDEEKKQADFFAEIEKIKLILNQIHSPNFGLVDLSENPE